MLVKPQETLRLLSRLPLRLVHLKRMFHVMVVIMVQLRYQYRELQALIFIHGLRQEVQMLQLPVFL